MTSTLTAIGAGDDNRPQRPAAPINLFSNHGNPFALAKVKVAGIVTMLEVLNNTVIQLVAENTELKTRVEQLEENAEEDERSISVLQDTVEQIQQGQPQLEGVSPFKTLRPNKSQRRVGLGHK